MNIWTVLLLIYCLMGIAFMTGPSWCEDSPFEDDPICAGADW